MTPPRRNSSIVAAPQIQPSDWLAVAAQSLKASKDALQQNLEAITPANVEAERLEKEQKTDSDILTREKFLEKFSVVLKSSNLEAMVTQLFAKFDALEQRQQDSFAIIESDLDNLKNNVIHTVASAQCTVVDVVQSAIVEQRAVRNDLQEQSASVAKLQSIAEDQDRILAQLGGLQSMARQEQCLTDMCAEQVKIGEERLQALYAKLGTLKEYTGIAKKAEVAFDSHISEDTDLLEFQNLVQDLRGICMPELPPLDFPDDSITAVNDVEECAKLNASVEVAASKLKRSLDSRSSPQSGAKLARELAKPATVDNRTPKRIAQSVPTPSNLHLRGSFQCIKS